MMLSQIGNGDQTHIAIHSAIGRKNNLRLKGCLGLISANPIFDFRQNQKRAPSQLNTS
jgi:hypothetical protein